MKFGELPLEVQVVVARVLAEKMQSAATKKPAELASEVRDVFTELYSHHQDGGAQRDCADPIPFAELPKEVRVAAPQSGKYIVCYVNGGGEWELKTYTDAMLDAVYAPSNKAAAMYSIECFFAGIEENKSIRNQLLGAGYLSGL